MRRFPKKEKPHVLYVWQRHGKVAFTSAVQCHRPTSNANSPVSRREGGTEASSEYRETPTPESLACHYISRLVHNTSHYHVESYSLSPRITSPSLECRLFYHHYHTLHHEFRRQKAMKRGRYFLFSITSHASWYGGWGQGGSFPDGMALTPGSGHVWWWVCGRWGSGGGGAVGCGSEGEERPPMAQFSSLLTFLFRHWRRVTEPARHYTIP